MTEVGYASDKPSDCAYCYFFSAGRKKCKRKECFYRISSPPLRRKVTHWELCEGCPYGKHTPCLGLSGTIGMVALCAVIGAAFGFIVAIGVGIRAVWYVIAFPVNRLIRKGKSRI